MKKILFLQIVGNSLGGVWFVNKALGEELKKRGYDVSVLAIRNNHPGDNIKDTTLKIDVINKKDKWEIVHKGDVFRNLFKMKLFKTLKQYFSDNKKLKEDYSFMKEKILEINPDYIIASHYQTLPGVPKQFLNRTIFVQHSSFNYLLNDRNNVRVLKKLNDQIFGLYWLCKSTMQRALDFGFKKNHYIYNPNKFTTEEISDVVKNKKIVVITRIAPEKRIDLMINIVNDVFKDDKLKDWKFEIYGVGEFSSDSKTILENSKQIIYKGLTNNPMEVLLNSSLTLNTSIYEGFSLSIIEGYSCGLPVIAFNFGESAHEQVIDDYNGYIIENDNIIEFKKKLHNLLLDDELLEKMSKNAKEFSLQFSINSIVDKWETVFKKIDEVGD